MWWNVQSISVCLSPLLDDVTDISKIKIDATLLGSLITIHKCWNRTWRNGFRTDFDNIFQEEIFTLSDFACNSLIDFTLTSDWSLKIVLSKRSFSNFWVNFQLEYPNIYDRMSQHLLLFSTSCNFKQKMKYKFKETKLIKYKLLYLAYPHWTIIMHSTGMKQSNSGMI